MNGTSRPHSSEPPCSRLPRPFLSGHAAVIGALILSALVFGFIPVGWSVWMVRTVPGHTEVVGGLYVAVVQGSVWLAANAGGVLYDASGVEPLFLMSAAIALFGSSEISGQPLLKK